MEFDSRSFRDALGCFATGVTIVTTRCANGSPEGLTVNSFASVSLEPPLVLFSVDRNGRCADHVAASKHFAIHILSSKHAELSRAFAQKGGADWTCLDWSAGAGGAPVLADSFATLECETHAKYDGGDHLIMVGRVVSLRHSEHEPLLYFRGRYRKISPTDLATTA